MPYTPHNISHTPRNSGSFGPRGVSNSPRNSGSYRSGISHSPHNSGSYHNGPRYSGNSTPSRQIRVIADESESSESSNHNKNDNESDSKSENGDMLIEDDVEDEDVDVKIEDGSENENENEHKKKRGSKIFKNSNDIELAEKGKDGKYNDSSNENDNSSSQKPHKHKSGHKTDVLEGGKENWDEDDDSDGDDGEEDNENEYEKKAKKHMSDEDKLKRKKEKEKRRRRKKNRKKRKEMKKKFIKLIKAPIKYAKTSIRCATITIFIIAYIVITAIFGACAIGMKKVLIDNDFKACDKDVDKVTKSLYDDIIKLSVRLEQYSLWDASVEVVTTLAEGNRTAFDAWYRSNFIWDGEWITNGGYNLIALYSLNNTCLYAEYHPSVDLGESTVEAADVPDYFLYAANLEFAMLGSLLGETGYKTGGFCSIMMPPGTTTPMIICQQPIFHDSENDTSFYGYILMALDFKTRIPRYAKEIFSCVSIWEDITAVNPDNAEALSKLKSGNLNTDGKWGGELFHKSYSLDDINKETPETGTIRVCSDESKFSDTGKNVASFFLFSDGMPGHPEGPLLRVDHPAAMEDYGNTPLIIIVVIVVVVFMITVVVLLVYLEYVVLRRISSLSKFLDGISKDASNERVDLPIGNSKHNDGADMSSAASKASKKGKRRNRSSKRSNTSDSNSNAEDTDDTDDTTSTSTTTSTASTSASTTSTSTATTSTSTTTSTASSKVNSVASSESTTTGATGTSGTSGSSANTTSSDSGDSTGGSSGNKNDEVWRLQKTMHANVDTLKTDITAANINIRKERRWRRRLTHALRLMNLWCGRKDIFPGLRGKDRPVGALSVEDRHNHKGHHHHHHEKTDGDGTRGYEDMSVDDMLKRPIAMEFLKMHSRFEESQENIFFLLDATWLQDLEKLEELESDPVKKAQMHDTVVNVADHILKRYIVQGAPQEINVSSESMSIVRKLSGTYSKNMFSRAVYDVKMMTSIDVLSRFKHTPAFLALSEILDVEAYDTMSYAAAAASGPKKSKENASQKRKSSVTGSISASEIQISVPEDEINDEDLQESDEENEMDEFEFDDEGNDDNSITNIDKPFRSTFRLMNAISDGIYKPNISHSLSSNNIFTQSDVESVHSNAESVNDNFKKSEADKTSDDENENEPGITDNDGKSDKDGDDKDDKSDKIQQQNVNDSEKKNNDNEEQRHQQDNDDDDSVETNEKKKKSKKKNTKK